MSSTLPFNSARFQNSDIIMLDTCFFLNFFGFDNSTYVRKQCEDLVKNATNSNAMFVISVKTLEELRNVIIRETFRSNNVNPSDMKGLRDTNYASFAAIMRQALNSYDNYIKKLENQPSFYPEPVGEINSDLIKKSEELHIKYNFPGPADSVQLALALQNEVSYFATTDSDFGYVTENSLDILLDGCAYRKYQNKITNI